jgi:hypothetical protein
MNSLLRIAALCIVSAFVGTTAFAGVSQPATNVIVTLPANENPALTASVFDKAKEVMTNMFSSMQLASVTDKPDISDDMKLALPTTESKLQPADQQSASAASAEASPVPNATAEQSVTPVADAAKPQSAAATANDKKDELIPVGRIVWVKGEISADHKVKGKRELTKQSIVFVGDTLITGAKTEAEIAFTDTTLLTLGSDTKFLVKEYAYHPDKKDEGSASVGKFVMELIAGGFRTITGLIPKGNPNDYKVETPVATIGVRGTDYSAFVRDTKATKKEKSKPILLMEQLKGAPVVNIPNKEPIVLTDNVRYVTVESDGSFTLTNKRPALLGEPLPIIPTKLEPITIKEIENTFTATSSGEWCIIQDSN